MSQVQWNSFRELSVFRAPGSWALESGPGFAERSRSESSWAPAVDVYETDDRALVVSAELRGIDPKDGTLRVTLPQKEEAKPQRIAITAG